ncbi:transcriptional repressor TCF25-domain-containing protein [Entophlyctis helioformis]|nr:transcriptional repressor TCF25-domain-containing protein [Entophlyctis helioformis]
MSSRALRKLLRERELAQADDSTRAGHNDSDHDQDEADDSFRAAPPKPSMFALLGGDDDDDGNDGDDANDNDDELDDDNAPVTPAAKSTSAAETGASQGADATDARTGKGKGASKDAAAGTDSEDLDEILRELNISTTDRPLPSEAARSQSRSLFAVDPRMLDADGELRRTFGARVVGEDIRRKKYIKALGTKRTLLATPRDTWPRLARLGLDMELVRTEQVDGSTVNHFSFTHSRSYQEVQFQFIQCVNTHDPNTISQLLRMHPYHIDALLQLSEVSKHNGDVATASELIERALYAFERSLHSVFSLVAGNSRLSFDRVENRPMFLCLYRHIGYLARRGCWRTALEFSKLLASFEPEHDPLCSLLSLDYYALMSKEYAWYKRFWDEYSRSKGLMLLPNAAFSIALVEWELECEAKQSHEASSRLLKDAIARFPSVVYGLFDKTGTTDASITANAFFFPQSKHNRANEFVLQILVDHYVEKAHSLWKVPEVLSWLRSQAAAVRDELSLSPRPKYIESGLKLRATKFGEGNTIPLNIQHIQSLAARLPRETVQGGILMYDPIPPDTAEQSVYDTFRVEQSRLQNPFADMSLLNSFVQSLLPWLNIGQGNDAAAQGGLAARIAAELARRRDGGRAVHREQGANAGARDEDQVMLAADLIARELPGMFPEGAEDDQGGAGGGAGGGWGAGILNLLERFGLGNGGQDALNADFDDGLDGQDDQDDFEDEEWQDDQEDQGDHAHQQ